RHSVYVAPHAVSSLLFPPFFFTATPPPEIYTLSLHDALPISDPELPAPIETVTPDAAMPDEPSHGVIHLVHRPEASQATLRLARDRKSTRLNSSHVKISYAVFCLKKKKEYTDH